MPPWFLLSTDPFFRIWLSSQRLRSLNRKDRIPYPHRTPVTIISACLSGFGLVGTDLLLGLSLLLSSGGIAASGSSSTGRSTTGGGATGRNGGKLGVTLSDELESLSQRKSS